MTRLADINVVFALLVEDHQHHSRAWNRWVTPQRPVSVLLAQNAGCPLVP